MKISNPSSQRRRRSAFPAWQWLSRTIAIASTAALILQPVSFASDAPVNPSAPDPVMKVMQDELKRATSGLAKTDPAPYYLSYTVYDQTSIVLVGAYGSLLTNTGSHRRQADVTMRVGSPALDNTHGQSRASGMISGSIPFGTDSDSIARVLWELTDRAYKRASPAFLNVKTNTAVRAEEEDKSPDFSKETSVTHTGEEIKLPDFDRPGWEGEIRRISSVFRKYPQVYFASVVLQVQNAKERMVTS